MADKSARAHTHQTNRERPRKATERKVVYKSVLENPFRVRWPSIPVNLQNVIFSHLTSLVEGAAAYHEVQSKASRKRKRERDNEDSKKSGKGRPGEDVVMKHSGAGQGETTLDLAEAQLSAKKPVILNHITCGINAVTKRLEAQARQTRRNVIMTTGEESTTQAPLSLVFVCRADVDPPTLIDHFPPLVAACNSLQANLTLPVKLIPLPKNSEDVLAAKLGIRRVSVIALDAQYSGIEELNSCLESVAPLTAPWLMLEAKATQLVPTHFKQLKTSAPKDMKVAKDARLKGKAAAKAKKKSTKPTVTVISS